MELITLDNGCLHVEIHPLGAEVRRIRDAAGVERLWDGDPAFWTGRAPVLFPVAGGLKDGIYRLNGVEYTLQRHGFARERMFTVERVDAGSATFLLAGEAAWDPGFPFPYEFRVRYTLAENALRVEYITTNTGGQTFWYSVGAHEAYAIPEGIDACSVVFDQPEALEALILQRGLLTHDSAPVPLEDGRVLRLHDGLFDGDTLVFANHRSRGVTLRNDKNDRTVRVDFADFGYLLIWKKQGANYLCIEPWTNLPDYLDTDQDIAHKPGMIRLDPGAERTILHTITLA